MNTFINNNIIKKFSTIKGLRAVTFILANILAGRLIQIINPNSLSIHIIIHIIIHNFTFYQIFTMRENLINDIHLQENPTKAQIHQRFFQTWKWWYGEWDIFIGLSVPQMRVIAKKHKTLPLNQTQKLLNSKYHEYRFIALLTLIDLAQKSQKNNQEKELKNLVDFYLKNSHAVNNRDLVDLSADKILGQYLFFFKSQKISEDILIKLSQSNNLRERRISMIACFSYIKNNSLNMPIKLANTLLQDKHDLIHKAVGRMLRELWKRNMAILCLFLDSNIDNMSRTTLRYAIEKFPEERRQYYLKK